MFSFIKKIEYILFYCLVYYLLFTILDFISEHNGLIVGMLFGFSLYSLPILNLNIYERARDKIEISNIPVIINDLIDWILFLFLFNCIGRFIYFVWVKDGYWIVKQAIKHYIIGRNGYEYCSVPAMHSLATIIVVLILKQPIRTLINKGNDS